VPATCMYHALIPGRFLLTFQAWSSVTFTGMIHANTRLFLAHSSPLRLLLVSSSIMWNILLTTRSAILCGQHITNGVSLHYHVFCTREVNCRIAEWIITKLTSFPGGPLLPGSPCSPFGPWGPGGP